MKKMYTIGLDYGSLSGRGVLVDIEDGTIVAEAAMEYPHGILDRCLPDGTRLGENWSLQDPQDYVEVLEYVVPKLLQDSQIQPESVIGLGIDFTASTVIPLDKDFRPLSTHLEFANRPHAWTKLWKHHSAEKQARYLTEICRKQELPYLDWYGGKISAEWLITKMVQVFEEDREIFEQTSWFVEAGDYMTSLLIGKRTASASMAAAKTLWSKADGYPPERFFRGFDADVTSFTKKMLPGDISDNEICYPGTCAGYLSDFMAKKLGLCPGIAVSAAQMDGYAAMPGIGIAEEGTMMMVIGTSTAIMVLSKEQKPVEGITACIPDTFYPGFFGYASGQASVGDGFQWFIDHCVPNEYVQKAEEQNKSIHQYLTELAAAFRPGETGLIALDWFNGNKSCLGNSMLSGMILGLNLQTKSEHIYRTLLEATAFGARAIMESYERSGIEIHEVVACGGIAGKNPLLMQIYADVLGKTVKVNKCTQAPALGSAIYAAAASGTMDLFQAVEQMGDHRCVEYVPDENDHQLYEGLYREYKKLHDYFGRGQNLVMEWLSKQRKGSE